MKTTDLNSRAFTLIEMMIVTICATLLIIPALVIFTSGTRTSMRGMARVDTVLEARIIIEQVTGDLKAAYLEFGKKNNFYLDYKNYVKDSGSYPFVEYQFFRYPRHGNAEDLLQITDSVSRRRLSTVNYRVEAGDDKNVPQQKILRRIEVFHPGHPLAEKYPNGLEKVLSRKISFFSIRPYQVEDEYQTLYSITLQLVDIAPGKSVEIAETGGKLSEGSSLISLVDFSSVVYPEFLKNQNAYFYHNLNWFDSLESSEN